MRPALRRTAVTLALTLALPLLPAPTGASAADPVSTAKREVAALQDQVDTTARELTDGTRQLERGQAELAKAQRRLATARHEAGASSARAAQAHDRLREVISSAYRSPLPDGVILAMTIGPERYAQAVVARADLDRVRGRQQDLLGAASTERLRAAGAVRGVEQLTDEVSRRTRELAAQTEVLRATAGRTEAKLTQAFSRLSSARREAARAARSRSFTTVNCLGGSLAGSANGFLQVDALCALNNNPGAALRADAAAAYNRMSAAFRADRGGNLCVTDSYRPYAAQVSVFRRKPALAAVPGTSRHGLGIALDLGCGVQRFGSASYRWMQANAGRFGWVHPSWAEPGGSMPEPWHWEYVR